MKKYVLICLGLITFILFLVLDNNWFYSSIESIVAPIFLVTLTLFLSNLYLLLFNPTIQQSWWRWARFTLIIPVALIIILLPTYENGGGFISFGGTPELVILWGVVLGAATFIYTLYQRFYLKTGVE
jgi:cation transport ATPase